MTREEIHQEIIEEYGVVPAAFRNVPDEFLEQEWRAWRSVLLETTRIPAPWKDLICLAMSVAAGDPYGLMYWRESAKRHGASDEDLREAAYLARMIVGFGPYMRANEVDYAKYEEEVEDILDHAEAQRGSEDQRPETKDPEPETGRPGDE